MGPRRVRGHHVVGIRIREQEVHDRGFVVTPAEGMSAADGKHYWLTPPALMESMQAEFAFDFDACPYPRPEDFDGLTVEWGSSTYVNPPFHGPTAWVRKAISESQAGKRVVLVFPIDKWIHMLLEAGAEVRNLKDVRWCAIEDGAPGKGTGRWIAQFVLEPKAFCAHGVPHGEACVDCYIARTFGQTKFTMQDVDRAVEASRLETQTSGAVRPRLVP